MKRVPRISENEWEIMRVIWSRGACSANQLIDALRHRDRSWHPKTAKTYLTRLVNKRALEFRKDGRAYVYSALVTEQQCVDAASESFLERVFGGSLRPMLAHFVEHKKLSASEIRELKQLLEEEE
ncbi:MAG TPA: BlaI/MecI/CopY family transcriptional regulator [Verrucomicrobiae bacterium]|jgi:BlaI family penicillinase repressor|nr:BlaI/MecI/CopY family transcriptional regulator [Verrucomicrobiae bacterium]